MEVANAPPPGPRRPWNLISRRLHSCLERYRRPTQVVEGVPTDGIGAGDAARWLRSIGSVVYLTTWTRARPAPHGGEDPLLDTSGNAIQRSAGIQ
jgi:hypothetical protein